MKSLKIAVALTLISLPAQAQFAAPKLYEGLYYDNYLKAEVMLNRNLYRNCEVGPVVGTFKFAKSEPYSRRPASVLSRGVVTMENCNGFDDGYGFIFEETFSTDQSMCKGTFQFADQVWNFESGTKGKDCLFSGRSYFVPIDLIPFR